MHQQCLLAGLVGCLLLSLGCRSTLNVQPYAGDGNGDGESVPFFLPRHDFVVEQLGFDEKGKPVADDRAGVRVSLVTRPDPARGFLVKNEVGAFSGSEFMISRESRGVLTSVSGKGDDKTLETAQAVVATIASAAAFASGSPEQALVDEQALLEDRIGDVRELLEKGGGCNLVGD